LKWKNRQAKTPAIITSGRRAGGSRDFLTYCKLRSDPQPFGHLKRLPGAVLKHRPGLFPQGECRMSITSITTARAQRVAQYPKTVLELAGLLGIMPEAAADRRVEARLSIAQRLATLLVKEREQGEIWAGPRNYDFNRHMSLAEAIGIELYGLVNRGPELSDSQMQETVDIAKKIAA
jgi:hypothetical protein